MPSVPSKSLYEWEGELVQRFGRAVAAERTPEAEQARELTGAKMRALQEEEARTTTEEAGARLYRPGTAFREGRLSVLAKRRASIAKRRAELEAEETP